MLSELLSAADDTEKSTEFAFVSLKLFCSLDTVFVC